ncbi:SDR family oxidoreductase [Microlunatus speluncae]|uniref:SDR family oxidoreductase n=1 Tax=Microlunatus speluncae TaxID=2594267 RepID=UPI0012662E24|nr:SDR family oxidoreductase [Microlunatus speluncae]
MSERTYVVTGSASGIGASTASILRDLGATIIGCDLNDADIIADLSTPAGRESLVAEVTKGGPIDAVLAVAGGGRTGLLETNYFGTVATLEGLRPLLARSRAPRAVAVSSTSSLAPADSRVLQACAAGDEAVATALVAADPTLREAAYGIAKRALNGWVRRAAPTPDWAGAGIPLNAVAPGVVDTPAAAWILNDDAVRAAVEAAAPQPLGGFPGRPEWVGQLIGWLAGPENRFVTGQVIFADGGAEAALLGDRQWQG